MAVKILNTEYTAKVSGESALPISFSPESGSFLPDFIKVTVAGDRLDVLVSGPELNFRTAQPYKTKRGLTGWNAKDFLEENRNERDAPPQWVVDFVMSLGIMAVRGGSL